MKQFEHMQKLHPGYGDQQHQLNFCARMDRMQELMPCPKDHQHGTGCYPAAVVETAVREQLAAAKVVK